MMGDLLVILGNAVSTTSDENAPCLADKELLAVLEKIRAHDIYQKLFFFAMHAGFDEKDFKPKKDGSMNGYYGTHKYVYDYISDGTSIAALLGNDSNRKVKRKTLKIDVFGKLKFLNATNKRKLNYE